MVEVRMTNAIGLSGNSWYPKLSCSYQNGNTYSQTALQQESGQSTVMVWFKFHSLKEEQLAFEELYSVVVSQKK